MLELPEVEVLRKDLEKEVVGKKVKDVIVETAALVTPFHSKRPDFVKALVGRKVEAARRRGRVLFLDLDDERTWIIDPGDSGYLHRETANEAPGGDTHLAVSFTVGGAIHLSEPGADVSARTGVVATAEALEVAEVAPDALDPLDDNPTWMEFGRFLQAADQPLKLLLTDPSVIAGIGPIYSDEILWEAGLRHDRSSASLSTQEVRRLYRAMQEVLQAAMKAAGSGLDESDAETSVDDDGEAAEHLHVFGREGLPCHRCRQPIARTRIKKGIYTFHCPQCMI
ncbi:Fpg/Nei family DNA glycosylase [Egicoccus sp. AB-alg6-2]|uniref:Fpg/Nei family DNA glycosylase n=1 Tax=Egicoccus sp. AB-alg6-2 TaxID=3242692 RepID=UPI00359D224A